MVRIEAVIDDRQWPKLSIVITRTNLDGTRAASQRSFLYDGAYSQFENDLHNQLRPAVDQLIQRRMNK